LKRFLIYEYIAQIQNNSNRLNSLKKIVLTKSAIGANRLGPNWLKKNDIDI